MSGLHRVTAIGGNPLRNLDFYRQTLGLRLVKRTINFGEPGTITLLRQDRSAGHTVFPWEHAGKGRVGIGETKQTAFRVPAEPEVLACLREAGLPQKGRQSSPTSARFVMATRARAGFSCQRALPAASALVKDKTINRIDETTTIAN